MEVKNKLEQITEEIFEESLEKALEESRKKYNKIVKVYNNYLSDKIKYRMIFFQKGKNKYWKNLTTKTFFKDNKVKGGD